MEFHRYLQPELKELIDQKLILLSGPRQVGKTSLSKKIFSDFAYYNYDRREDFHVFKNNEWDHSGKLLIFDEIHKMKKWKLWLKDIVDGGRKNKILVTGSARLDMAKKMGDSLAGRYFSMRLNPLDLKEAASLGTPEENYAKLLNVGGFPEPFFNGTEKFYGLWKRTHLDIILRQDLISLENVRDIDGIELLVQLLSERVGSTISMNSLAKDIGRDDKTISKWLIVLENLFIIFKVPPYAKNMALGIKKSSKYYFYDIARVQGDESRKLENLVALSLKKEIEFLQDTQGIDHSLHFSKDKQHREIDFVVNRPRGASLLIEVKLSDEEPSKNFDVFARYFPKAEKIQLVRNIGRPFLSKSGVHVVNALEYLTKLDLIKIDSA
jgi:predicted AAA+ superfamily ATPase